MLRCILLLLLAGCAFESGSTALTSTDLNGYNPIYAKQKTDKHLI